MLTALSGMQVPAEETAPADSAVFAADILPQNPTVPETGAVTAAEDAQSHSVHFNTGSGPLKIAEQIRAQIKAAAQMQMHEEQIASLNETMSHTQFLLTGETELLQDVPESETEFLEETETEYHEEETETESEVWPVDLGESVPSDAVSDASAENDSPDSPEVSDEADSAAQPRPRRGAISVPALGYINIARVNLYDYRMIRTYPLPSLPKDLHRLYDKLKELTGGFEGEWSVYVQNLSTNQSLVFNDKALNSASVMKLFIMETVYEAFDNGTMTRDGDMVYLLRNMIINSSNDSSNRLLTILGDGDLAAGIAKVNDFILRHGYTSETAIHNGFQDPATTLDADHPNVVRAKDVGLLLSRVYNREFISRRVCNEIEQMMLEQGTRYKIPRGVPDWVDVGNKSGETSDTANDAAVVYASSVDYILVVLSHGWSNENAANDNVVKVSALVYDFFEN